MPAAVVLKGEYAGTAGRVPTDGVNNCAERQREKRIIQRLVTVQDVLSDVQLEKYTGDMENRKYPKPTDGGSGSWLCHIKQ